jgi:alanyl-tRNA synthetase
VSTKAFTIKEIRASFLEYFESKRHLIEKSASLMPAEDPTLLFTTAGMVPFKDYFSGIVTPPSPRIASVQKCFRTTDLSNVGRTKRHMSMFEMLGNFSFGDYFKKEAIEFAWEYVTTRLPFDKDKIWVTIYLDDDEAFDIWHNHIGMPSHKIVRLGKRDNFWGPAGSTGACGPCSELYLDRGDKYTCFSDDPRPGDEGERFMEFWNLVFNQFDLKENGDYAPLKSTGIDTGAGLERLATLVQGVDSVFDTDELMRLRKAIEQVYGVEYVGDNIDPIRVLTDHVRALTFTMSDGIFPSNESRGYVLRRLLRRALLFGRKIGQREPLLYKLVPTVVDIYGYFYPELNLSVQLVSDYIQGEERRFLQTLEVGYQKINDIMRHTKEFRNSEKMITGKEIFTLYDTFGFPPEMTQEIAESEGFQIDLAGFGVEMEKQRSRGKSAWKGDASVLKDITIQTKFIGYDLDHASVKVAELLFVDESVKGGGKSEIRKTIHDHEVGGKVFYLVTDQTPCYPESGGQMGDYGFAHGKNFNCKIVDTQKQGNSIIHVCEALEGEISVGAEIEIKIDSDRRENLRKNHSVTHLLNAALRKKFGAHIKQSGSLVDPEYLRFDFTHPNRLAENEVEDIEVEVNTAINRKLAVNTRELVKAEAEKTGAVMNFGEKYGDVVRVVKMSDTSNDYSVEFCGGTHVNNTGDIKLFLIAKESSPGAGNRRIEAVTFDKACQKIVDLENALSRQLHAESHNIADAFKDAFTKLQGELQGEMKKPEAGKFSILHWHAIKQLEKQIVELIINNKKALKKSAVSSGIDEELLDNLVNQKVAKNGHNVISGMVEGGIAQMKTMVDYIRSKSPDSIIILFSADEPTQKWNLLLATTYAYAEKTGFDASKNIKQLMAVHPELKGGGGGKKELAQATGAITAEGVAAVEKKLTAGAMGLV